ncbi:MAG: hypothetical protein ACREJC_03090 [Tepidisphaeraceae bacterium]
MAPFIAFVVLVSLGAYVAWCTHYLLVRLPRERANWASDKPRQSTIEWLHLIGIPPELSAVAKAARDSLALTCRVPPETISADVRFRKLEHLTSNGFDPLEFILRVEEELGIQLECRDAERLPQITSRFVTVGDWVRAIVAQWQELGLPQVRRR